MIHLLESPPGALVGIVTRVFNEYGLRAAIAAAAVGYFIWYIIKWQEKQN